uniref:N-acetyl sugar amidotransferase n=2 Tax=Roseivirga sp. TaxID=1964215 RepID=UPI004047B748
MYNICQKCVLDTIANPDITFDENGICNYHHEYHEKKKQRVFRSDEELNRIVAKVKRAGKGRDYDCIVGVSGGVDSTYLAYIAKTQFGLRPLAVHFDNGWNSELAVKNIENTLEKLDIDLFTYVVDWEEFKNLQISFLKSSTPDGEIPTDHAIIALLFKIASQKGIKYILNGNNFTTEGIMPPTWAYGHIDLKYINGIHKRFGSVKLKTYPKLTLLKYVYYTLFKRIRIVSLLNYIDYQKKEAMDVLRNELEWKYYGGKHYESVYTRFYQGYVLPEKFKIDKRKVHLSTLIFANQLELSEAQEELRAPIYPEGMLEQDMEFVLKKFGLSQQEFDKLMKDEVKTFKDYPNTSEFHLKLRKMLNNLRERKILPS